METKVNEIIPILEKHILENQGKLEDSLEKIILFGSHARGEATVDSDIDIALVYREGTKLTRALRATVRYLLDDLFEHVEINLLATTSDKVASAEDKKDANYWIREEGRVLWGSWQMTAGLSR